MKKGLLVVGHGSRSDEAKKGFNEIVDIIKDKTDQYIVKGAYMEISKPFIPDVVENMVEENIKDIVVVPYFLYEGIHIKEDIPKIIEKLNNQYKDVQFRIANPLGVEPVLADILLQRVKDID